MGEWRGMVKYFSLEFFKKLAEEVNANPAFKTGMGDFNASMILRETDKGFGIYFEIRDGQIQNVREAKPGEEADFILEGPYEVWVRLGKAELMARDALMSGQISLTGSMMMLLAYADGFGVLLQTMAAMPKEF
ncbi:MAG: SCP2 sterol-binding domain-containing protein [Candidatus Freyarchaeota archaeon]|nr:SCP2 sterol-binding domain-containing protein [Candidatus Freyrarchaeum guaymaensis]